MAVRGEGRVFLTGCGGSAARSLMAELLDAARRGVRVRVIADQLYSGSDPKNIARFAIEFPVATNGAPNNGRMTSVR